MRPTRREMHRVRVILSGGLGLVTALTLGIGTASAAPAPFTVSPTSLSFGDVPQDTFAYLLVTVTTGGKKVALDNPARFAGSGTFFDTQAGTCWQSYGAHGMAVPARTSCTIQVGFHPQAPGAITDVMTVAACKKSHVEPGSGFLVCDALDGSRSVNLSGTGTVPLPDLIISGFQWGDPLGTPWGYTLQVQNVGAATADLTNVMVAGYYGDGQTFDPNTQKASCARFFDSGTSLAAGATTSIAVSCGNFPGGPEAGEPAIGVKVDFLNVLPESHEDNNIVFALLPPA